MAARLLTLACVVHQASSFAAPLSRPAGVVVDELLPLLDEGGTTRSRNKSPETISKIDACLEELREAGRGAKVLDDPRLFGEFETVHKSNEACLLRHRRERTRLNG